MRIRRVHSQPRSRPPLSQMAAGRGMANSALMQGLQATHSVAGGGGQQQQQQQQQVGKLSAQQQAAAAAVTSAAFGGHFPLQQALQAAAAAAVAKGHSFSLPGFGGASTSGATATGGASGGQQQQQQMLSSLPSPILDLAKGMIGSQVRLALWDRSGGMHKGEVSSVPAGTAPVPLLTDIVPVFTLLKHWHSLAQMSGLANMPASLLAQVQAQVQAQQQAAASAAGAAHKAPAGAAHKAAVAAAAGIDTSSPHHQQQLQVLQVRCDRSPAIMYDFSVFFYVPLFLKGTMIIQA